MWRWTVMLSLLLAIPAFGAETQLIKVPVSGHGTLELTMPKEWTSRVQSLGEVPPTVRVTGPADEPKLLITAFWNTAEEPKFNSAESINVLMAGIVEHIQPSAVQEKLEIHDLHGFAGPDRDAAAHQVGQKHFPVRLEAIQQARPTRFRSAIRCWAVFASWCE